MCTGDSPAKQVLGTHSVRLKTLSEGYKPDCTTTIPQNFLSPVHQLQEISKRMSRRKAAVNVCNSSR